MSGSSWTFFIIGIALALFGLLRLGGGAAFIQRNFGINIGGTQTQINYRSGAPQPASEPKKTDWMGLAIAIVGLLTAIFSYLKG